jgi:hypothetical protein
MAFDTASKEMDPVEDALMGAWSNIQKIKEVVDAVTSAHHSNASLAISALQKAVESLTTEYSQWGGILPELARNSWHDAKKSASMVLAVITNYSPDPNSSPEIPQEFLTSLRAMHSTLTDHQLAISTSRQNLRQESARKILEIL